MKTSRSFLLSRRELLRGAACALGGAAFAVSPRLFAAARPPANLAEETFAFIRRCARPDGGYAPSPDSTYAGRSDTGASDLAAVTYAATLAKTMGWRLPEADRSVEFIQRHQQPDGTFINLGGTMDPKSNLAVLYNTVQGVVALRALGNKPKHDATHALDRFFAGDAYKKPAILILA